MRSAKITEGDHQLRLMRWAAKQSLTIPELGRLFHVPNGGARDRSTAGRLRLEGVKAGVPDLMLPVPSRGYHGLWLELKADGGRTSSAQDDWLAFLNAQGYCALVCYGADEAYRHLVDYLDLHGHPDLLTLDREPIKAARPF